MEEAAAQLHLQLQIVGQALSTLEEALQEPYTVLVRDATIQRFEYTFELAWKLLRKVAKVEGLEVGSPRQAIRAAFDIRLLNDVDTWFELLEDRNRTSHTYNARTAESVYESAQRLPAALRAVMEQVRARYMASFDDSLREVP